MRRGLRTEFRLFSRILRLNSPASLSPQNSVSRTTRWRGRSRGFAFAKLSAEEGKLVAEGDVRAVAPLMKVLDWLDRRKRSPGPFPPTATDSGKGLG